MKEVTIETIGWTLFGITVVISITVMIIIITLTSTASDTERLTACVEAGLVWVRGTCI